VVVDNNGPARRLFERYRYVLDPDAVAMTRPAEMSQVALQLRGFGAIRPRRKSAGIPTVYRQKGFRERAAGVYRRQPPPLSRKNH
jgi:hypothetical protein